VQRRNKQKRAARAAISEAAAEFARLGASLWFDRAEAELARVGGHSTEDSLTATERRVAELIAAGRSYPGRRRAVHQPEDRPVEPVEGCTASSASARAELPARLAEETD
jgi:hypothetical protein